MTPTGQQIRENKAASALFVWVLVIVWIGFCCLLLSLPRNSKSNSSTLSADVAACFGLIALVGIGLLLLLLAVQLSSMLAKYGESVFDSPMLRAVPGGVITGTIHLQRPLTYMEPVHLHLTCRKQIGSGRGTTFVVLWQGECTLNQFAAGSAVSDLPVYFKLPADAQPTVKGQITWNLQAKAKTLGVSYASAFRVPVVAEPVSSEMLSLADPTAAYRSLDPSRNQPSDRHIHVTPLPGSGSRVELLPGRSHAPAISQIIFGVLVAGIGAIGLSAIEANRRAHGLIFIPASFCAVGALLCLFGVTRLLLKTTVTIRRGIILIEKSGWLRTRRREISAANIREIAPVIINYSVGPYYSIYAVENGIGRITICDLIKNKADAEWLAREFKRELGLP
jgi:hypothetical protein